jgi:hypothetical protein
MQSRNDFLLTPGFNIGTSSVFNQLAIIPANVNPSSPTDMLFLNDDAMLFLDASNMEYLGS